MGLKKTHFLSLEMYIPGTGQTSTTQDPNPNSVAKKGLDANCDDIFDFSQNQDLVEEPETEACGIGMSNMQNGAIIRSLTDGENGPGESQNSSLFIAHES